MRRPVTPAADDVEAFEQLVTAATDYAARLKAWREGGEPNGVPSGEMLFKARARCRNKVLPVDQQRRDAPLVRLLRLVDQVANMPKAERARAADELLDLARKSGGSAPSAAAAAAPIPAPSAGQAHERPARRRRDIHDFDDD